MESSKSRETTGTRSRDGSVNKAERPSSQAARRIPGPGRWETLKRLYPVPLRALPRFLEDLSQRYGPIASFAIPTRRFVLVNEPDLIKEILVTQQHHFTKSEGGRTLRMLLGNGLLTSEEPLHRQMRRIVQPAFHHEHIARYATTMQSFARDFTEKCEDGDVFDMHAAMNELTLRIAGATLFGTDAEADAKRVRGALHGAMETYPLAIGPIGKMRRRLPWLGSTRRFNAARAMLDRVVFALIAQRRASGQQRTDALSLLLAAEDSRTGMRLSDEQLRDEAMTLFLAGHETTSNALLWTWYLLAQNPDVERRLHEEVDAIPFDAADPFEVLRGLQYTARVVRESMRLFPPAWIIGRESQCAVLLPGGYRIPAKTTVFICPLVLHRRSELYDDPERFDPDRWLIADRPAFAYVPFGGGARRCIGEEFAWTETVLVLSMIAKAFRFELESDAPVETEAIVTLRPRRPVLMRAMSRSKVAHPLGSVGRTR